MSAPERSSNNAELALSAASHYDQLALDADNWAAYEEKAGRFGGVHRNKAQLYRRTAEALRLESSTGRAHCVCCLKVQSC